MQGANITSYRALAARADVSRWQIQQLRAGNYRQMRLCAIAQIAEALNLSTSAFFKHLGLGDAPANTEAPAQLAQLQQDYQRLHNQLEEQEVVVRSRLQSEALQTLESWLVQWPTIAQRAQEKGDALPAAKLLPFVKPVEQLMAEWGVEAIAPINAQVPYDPTLHQLMGSTVNPGDPVQVTHSGQRHSGRLLHRAKVKAIASGG